MGKPDVTIGKIFFWFTLVCLSIIPFTLIIVYMKLSFLCKKNKKNKTGKISSGKKFVISLIIICILSGLAAQAINHSYTLTYYT